MSKELIEREIRRFLETSTEEVLCIRGKWGIGKTFSWKRYLGEAQRAGRIALGRYAYVSLFGVNSLDELKYSIFENTVPKENVSQDSTVDTFQSAVKSLEVYGRWFTKYIERIPVIGKYVGGSAPVFFLAVRDQIICIDDLERRGKGLDLKDVLGLASFLKEQRRCKVVLLLNDEALKDDEKEEFETYFEKVVDVSVKFIPSAKDSTQIAVPGTDNISKLIAANCVTLGISNIRVIKKIERFMRDIVAQGSVKDLDDLVLKQISQSVTLLAWSVYQPDEAPRLEYLTARKSALLGLEQQKEMSAEEGAWNALLDAYGMAYMDELDYVLLEGVRNGFFDAVLVRKHAKALNGRVEATKAEVSFEAAWRLYHDSFEDNQDKVLDGLYAALTRSIHQVTPLNLAGTVRLFRELGRSEQASDMIMRYVNEREEDASFFDLEQYPFAGDIRDPEIIDAFKAKLRSFAKGKDVGTSLLELKEKGLVDETIATLANATVDQYYSAFKTNRGDNLHRMIEGSLQFNRIGNATDEMKEISRKATQALERIGKESAVNALRVATKYGISIKH